jgi:thymidylate synthase
MINIILSISNNNVIGSSNGSLAFHCKKDLQKFKELTTNHNLIVGYKTYLTLPEKMLEDKQRKYFVITNKKLNNNNNNIVFFNFEEIKLYIAINNKQTYWVIGGKQIYDLFLPIANYIHLTKFDKNSDMDIVVNIPEYYVKIDCNSEKINDIDKISNSEILFEFIKLINCKSTYNNGEYQYLNILKKALTSKLRNTRNGNTFSYFGDQIKFDLRNGFPLLTTKKMFIKGIIYELLFFLKGSTNTKELENVGVNIWKGNTSREFLDTNGFNDKNEGDMGPMYGYQWRKFNGELDQLKQVLDTIKKDPNSRRLLLTTFNPLQVHLGVLYPCHSLIIQFYIEPIETNKYYISIQMYQRSADVFLGLPFNIASTSLFLSIICNYLTNNSDNEYIPKDVIISLGDVHLYESHIEQALLQISRNPLSLCNLKIINTHNNIDEYKYDDFVFENYISHDSIKAEMVA